MLYQVDHEACAWPPQPHEPVFLATLRSVGGVTDTFHARRFGQWYLEDRTPSLRGSDTFPRNYSNVRGNGQWGRRVRDQSFWTSWDRKGTPLHSAKRTTKSNGRPQTVPWWLRSRFQNQSDGTDLTRRLDLTGFGIRYGQVAASFLTKQRS